MVAYRVYFLDGVNRFTRAENIEEASTEEAISRAREMMNGAVKCEIWNQQSLVARVTAADWPK